MSVNFPEYFRVDLTQEDIDNGFMGSRTKCAIAVAFNKDCPGELGPSGVEVDEGSIGFSAWDHFDAETGHSTYQTFEFDMSDDLRLHARAYDLDKRRVKPVNIHFNITSIHHDEEHNEMTISGDADVDLDITDLIIPRGDLPHVKEIDGMIG